MDPRYAIADTSQIFSPAMIIYRDLVEANIREMVRIAGSPARLRPHCKTHKMKQVCELQKQAGITKHKCATLAEAEMLAQAGIEDIFLAYNPVGPNIGRCIAFLKQYPQVRLLVTADHPQPIAQLGAAASAAGVSLGVLLDLDAGMHRTGVAPGPDALRVYATIAATPGLTPAGFHLYDGHNNQKDVAQRAAGVQAAWQAASSLRRDVEKAGFPVPRIVAGGTGAFPIYAQIDDPVIELSPGTVVFHDWGYGDAFPDLHFQPAALLLTRCISRPTPDRATFDLGYKAVASDPPAGNRLTFPDLPDAKAVLQNEEHLVLETAEAGRFAPGDELLAIPRHVCPTSALHKFVYVVSGGRVVDTWEVAARDRMLTV